MRTAAVTIAGPDKRADVVVSTETPISDLMPTFLELALDEHGGDEEGPAVWSVAPAGKQPLPFGRSLGECGVSDGAVLTLTKLRSEALAPPKPSRRRVERRKGSPRDRTQRALPERLGTAARLSLAIQAFFDHEPEPPIVESSEPEKPSTRETLTRAERSSAVERWKRSWRESEYLARLDRAIAAPRLARCATIAVVSPKGGVGKTTITALLGSLLARVRSDRVVAVDTNPDYGSLGRTLTPDHDVYVDDLLDVLERPDLTVTQLDQHLGRAMDGLMVLPAPTNPERMARLDEGSYRTVIGRLQELVGVLVLDCGTGLQEPAARAALATADQVILVTDGHPATASLVTEAAELLRTEPAPITLVVNKLPRRRDNRLDLDRLAELVEDARGLVVVDEDVPAATAVAAGELDWRDAPAAWQRSVRELAVVLQSDWDELGIARG